MKMMTVPGWQNDSMPAVLKNCWILVRKGISIRVEIAARALFERSSAEFLKRKQLILVVLLANEVSIGPRTAAVPFGESLEFFPSFLCSSLSDSSSPSSPKARSLARLLPRVHADGWSLRLPHRLPLPASPGHQEVAARLVFEGLRRHRPGPVLHRCPPRYAVTK